MIRVTYNDGEIVNYERFTFDGETYHFVKPSLFHQVPAGRVKSVTTTPDKVNAGQWDTTSTWTCDGVKVANVAECPPATPKPKTRGEELADTTVAWFADGRPTAVGVSGGRLMVQQRDVPAVSNLLAALIDAERADAAKEERHTCRLIAVADGVELAKRAVGANKTGNITNVVAWHAAMNAANDIANKIAERSTAPATPPQSPASVPASPR